MNNSLFDDIIKQSVDGHQSEVPAEVWNNISGKRKKRRFFLFWWLLAGLIIAGTGISVVKKLNNKQRSEGIASVKNIETKDTDKPASVMEDQNKVADKKTGNTSTPVQLSGLSTIQNTNSKQIKNIRGKTNPVSKRVKNKTALPAAGDDALAKRQKKTLRNNGASRIKIKQPDVDSYNTENNTAFAVPDDRSSAKTKNETVDVKKETATAIIKKNDSVKTNTPPAAETVKKKEKKKTSGKWHIEVSAMPVFALQQFEQPLYLKRTVNTATGHSVFTSNTVNTSFDPAVAYTIAGIKTLNTKLNMGLGLQYLELKEKISLSGTDTTTTFNIVKRLVTGSVSSFLIDDTVSVIEVGKRNINAQNSYRYINIPLFIQYKIIDNNRWGLGITAGLNLNISTKYQNSIKGDIDLKYSAGNRIPGNKSNIGVSYFAGLRASVKISKRMDIFAMPVVTYKPGTYDLKNAILNKKVQQAGISVGLSLKIK